MNCDICGQLPQALIISDMSTGEQQFLCGGCFARWGLDFAKAVLPPEEIAERLGPMFVQSPRAQNAPAEKAAKSRPGRKTKAPAAQEPEPQPGEPEVAAAAEDG